MAKLFLNALVLSLFGCCILFAQIENVPTTNTVYQFLKRMQVKGLIEEKSFFKIPFTRSEIKKLLIKISEHQNKLSYLEQKILNGFLIEFEILPKSKAVLIFSETDTNLVLSSKIISSDEKYIYHYSDDSNSVSVKPLGSVRSIVKFGNEIQMEDAIYGNLGFRIYGTIDSSLGFFLQVTNGKFISGSKTLGTQEDKTLSNSVKFTLLNSDFDLVESHVRYQKNWFSVGFSRETRLLGSGVYQNLVVSDNAPPMDEFFLAVNLKNFRYNFSHFSLIADHKQVGFSADIPPKYFVLHSATFLFKKWNLTYFETITYSGRSVELAYLNPLTFLKSVEHSLHDRDKAAMGLSFEWNVYPNFLLLGSWMMEDLILSEIGKNFWGNKTAWNIGAIYSSSLSTDFGLEYTRVEPYMFTHFNNVNNRTNDGKLIGTYLFPNSDELGFLVKGFFLQRYPLNLRISYQRHGDNVKDSTGQVIRNVGGDYKLNHSSTDSDRVKFLDGIRNDLFSVSLSGGIEIIRNFNLQFLIEYRKPQNQQSYFISKIVFRFDDF